MNATTTPAPLPTTPLDDRFVWARDMSTGRLHIAGKANPYTPPCNRRFRVRPTDTVNRDSGTCPVCVVMATSPKPEFH